MPETYAVQHYENFPVASVLLPRRMRRPVQIVYRFARSADDFADEGTLEATERLNLLNGYREELARLAAGTTARTPLFQDLGREVIDAHGVPLSLFTDLLDAFSQDVVKTRYAHYPELLDYCRRSANPVGRIVLHLAGQATSQHLLWSDQICTALQLINFWQDIAIDWQKDRVYLPQDDLATFKVPETQIGQGDAGGAWWPLLQFQINRSRALMQAGAPLGHALPGRLGLEIRLTVQGGLAILRKLDAAQGDIFRHRPVLGPRDWPGLLGRALWPRKLPAR